MKLHVEIHGEGSPLVVVHGLFGSGENWRTLARAWAAPPPDGPGRQVLAVDLRNHGRSPWSATMTFAEMAADLVALLDARRLATASVLGHSLGGKVAMTLALAHPERVERLVVVDIAPRAYPQVQEDILAAMRALDPAAITSRGEADRQLAAAIPERAVRQFLLKSLEARDQGGYRWQLHLVAIAEAQPRLRAAVTGSPVEVPVLVVRGEHSGYVTATDVGDFQQLFPQVEIVTVPAAGHWVHAEQPAAVRALVTSFLTRSR